MACLSRFFSLPTGQRLAIVSLTALVIEIGFLAGLPARYRVNENADYWTDYKPVAESIVSGRGITGADGNLELRYPPGYSAFLACAFRTADALNLEQGQDDRRL